MYKKISDYSIIGNLHSVALIGLDGSIDWLCLPYIDSPSIFGALLDEKKGGYFSVSPINDWDSTAEYIEKTNILITRFRTRSGILHITDFMTIPSCGEDHMGQEQHELYRILEVRTGNVEVQVLIEPRFNYAGEMPFLEQKGDIVIAKGKKDHISFSATRDLHVNKSRISAVWNLREGEKVYIRMNYNNEKSKNCAPRETEKELLNTETYWRNWLERSETVMTIDLGDYQQMVDRSALALKLLYFSPTGTISAAATTSLPEEIGRERNWDYRFTWIRDTAFTLQALFNLGHLTEVEGYLRWIEKIISEHGTEKLQIMYGLRGEESLPELELEYLEGYKASKPVRIGNKAAEQKQIDIYGEIMDAALKLSDYVGKIDRNMWPFLRDICDHVVQQWKEKDHGIWEIRGGPHHFVYSKVMCWVALDRGIAISRRYGFPSDIRKWERVREDIKDEVLRKGFNASKQAFVQHYNTDSLDSSNLLIPICGFLPFDDPRAVSTLEATRKELSHGGLLYRYTSGDGLGGEEGAFLLCTFWLIDNLIGLGRLEEAEALLRKIENISNHVGLFSEEYNITWHEQLGNFPQAFTHIGYINSVVALCKARGKLKEDKTKSERIHLGKKLFGKILLNEGEPATQMSSTEVIKRLKSSVNILRGSFFNTKEGRVSYEMMRHSDAYNKYVQLTYALKKIDLADLKTREQKIAFWINLFNVIVIHGVIELGIRDSVKEVRNFFGRVQYNIADMLFSPDDIEHGILRGNRRPPWSLTRLFKKKDERLYHTVQEIDPRIHFALVCASSSCPPIEIYTEENLEEELTVSGETFLNAGGAILEKEMNRISISRIFKWYSDDFGKNDADRLRFIASYLYNREERSFIEEHAEKIKIAYQEYDWRLNRSKN